MEKNDVLEVFQALEDTALQEYESKVETRGGIVGLEVYSKDSARWFVVSTSGGDWSEIAVESGHGFLDMHDSISDTEHEEILRGLVDLGIRYLENSSVVDERSESFRGGSLKLESSARRAELTLSISHQMRRLVGRWFPKR